MDGPTYAELVADVLDALTRSSVQKTGGRLAIGGLGAGNGDYTGWCPTCLGGIVRIHVLDTIPLRVRTWTCEDGCPPELIENTIWPNLTTIATI
jgi:hypothetical protein